MAYPGIAENPHYYFQAKFDQLVRNIERVIRGKRHEVELALIPMLAGGHLLIDDVPGLGKTSLAKAVARSIEGKFQRVQFTADTLPGDITGFMILDEGKGRLSFREGPVFANVVLCDEVNRASPKAQSALLEVMEERQVSADGGPRPVPHPFMVVATQNPIDFAGTYPLLESQLDRFMMCIQLGYPDAMTEREILKQESFGPSADTIPAVMDTDELEGLIKTAQGVRVDDQVHDLIVRILRHTRAQGDDVRLGASPRAGIALVKAARVRAVSQGRHFVSPEDIDALAPAVLAHRIVLDGGAAFRGVKADQVVQQAVWDARSVR
jgi:MoxR-like ATPase